MAAPLLIGSDLRKVNEDTFTILKNTDVIAVDQDPLGRQGTVVSSTSGRVVYSKVLANGDRAVALSNETTSTADDLDHGRRDRPRRRLVLHAEGPVVQAGADDPGRHQRLRARARHRDVPGDAQRVGVALRGRVRDVISGGVVESNHAGFSGTGFVNTDNAAGPYVEWTINSAAGGAATLSFGYANGTTANRPLDVSVNGTLARDRARVRRDRRVDQLPGGAGTGDVAGR